MDRGAAVPYDGGMFAKVTRRFDDPDAYATGIRGASTRLMRLGRGEFRGQITRVDLESVWIQRLDDNMSRLAHVVAWPQRRVLVFSMSDLAPMRWGGAEAPFDMAYHFATGHEVHQHTAGPTDFAAMSLPERVFEAAGASWPGADMRLGDAGMTLRPNAAPFALLRRVHDAATRLARENPGLLAQEEVTRNIEQELTRLMLASLAGPQPDLDGSTLRQHRAVMRRLDAYFEAVGDRPVYVVEACQALGVSARTLQRCCQEQVGMGPVRYLWHRRMHLARRDLLRRSAGQATVTAIATRHGFWELGRFATEYRRLFGESPSATLRLPAG